MAERDWIARYFAPLAKAPGAAGLGDDVAMLREGPRLVTVDGLVEGVHFLSNDPIETVARKLIRVNVSDLYAKGARPVEALLTLVWPTGRDEAQLAAFAAALGEECHQFGIDLLGGDTLVAPGPLTLSLTLTGASFRPDGAPIRRVGARPGDTIFVTGSIGAGGCGLRDARADRQTPAAMHYRVPDIPGRNVAEWIAGYAHAAMDISDGLIGDLAQLLAASGVGARLALDKVPLIEPGSALAHTLFQCTAGDDYQALIAAPAKAAQACPVELTAVGTVEAGSDLVLMHRGQIVPTPVRAAYQHA